MTMYNETAIHLLSAILLQGVFLPTTVENEETYYKIIEQLQHHSEIIYKIDLKCSKSKPAYLEPIVEFQLGKFFSF